MDGYQWIMALHVISVIAWMAGLLYLPRLFVYHCQTKPGSETSEMFKVMERRLLKAIMNPAAFATLFFGIWMIVDMGNDAMGLNWLHLKMAAVLGLLLLHGFMIRWQRAFAVDRNTRSERFYRVVNEGPTVLMIAIIILVIVKPF